MQDEQMYYIIVTQSIKTYYTLSMGYIPPLIDRVLHNIGQKHIVYKLIHSTISRICMVLFKTWLLRTKYEIMRIYFNVGITLIIIKWEKL